MAKLNSDMRNGQNDADFASSKSVNKGAKTKALKKAIVGNEIHRKSIGSVKNLEVRRSAKTIDILKRNS